MAGEQDPTGEHKDRSIANEDAVPPVDLPDPAPDEAEQIEKDGEPLGGNFA